MLVFKASRDTYTLPLASPLYSPPPWYSLGTMVQMVHYEARRDAIESLLPGPLEYCSDSVIAWISRGPFSTHGPLNEAAIYLSCIFEGVRGVYEPFVYCDQEVALVSGREVIGWAKKPGQISLQAHNETMRGELRRGGARLMSLTCTTDREASLDEVPFGPEFIVKIVPSAEADAPAEVAQIVRWEGTMTPRPGQFFGGRGSVHFDRDDVDPLYILEPERVIAGYYGVVDMVLPNGKVVYSY